MVEKAPSLFDGNKKGRWSFPQAVWFRVRSRCQLVLLARTSPVTARVGKAVIKEAAKVVAARGLGHACRIGPQRTRRQARSLVEGSKARPPGSRKDPRVTLGPF